MSHSSFSPGQTPREQMKIAMQEFARSPWENPDSSGLSYVEHMILPPNDDIREALPLAARVQTKGKYKDTYWMGRPAKLVKTAIAATYEAYYSDNEQVVQPTEREYAIQSSLYWMLDTVRANYNPRNALELAKVPITEAAAILAVSSIHLGLKEGAVRDMLNETMRRSPRRSGKDINITLGLVKAAFSGINKQTILDRQARLSTSIQPDKA